MYSLWKTLHWWLLCSSTINHLGRKYLPLIICFTSFWTLHDRGRCPSSLLSSWYAWFEIPNHCFTNNTLTWSSDCGIADTLATGSSAFVEIISELPVSLFRTWTAVTSNWLSVISLTLSFNSSTFLFLCRSEYSSQDFRFRDSEVEVLSGCRGNRKGVYTIPFKLEILLQLLIFRLLILKFCMQTRIFVNGFVQVQFDTASFLKFSCFNLHPLKLMWELRILFHSHWSHFTYPKLNYPITFVFVVQHYFWTELYPFAIAYSLLKPVV